MRKLLLPCCVLLLLAGCGEAERLAFLHQGEVFLWSDGMERAVALTDRDDVVDFVFSPSGRHLAYLVEKPHLSSFWCYTALDDPNEVKTRSRPLFSAGGRRVAYIRERDFQLILLDEDGGSQIEVSQWVQAAQWNGAGSQLAYIEDGDLKVFHLSGMTSRFLASDAVAGPDFIADDMVLYVSIDETLCAARTDGGGVFRLVEKSREYHIPRTYSGQVRGNRLICVDIDRDAYLMDFDGSNRVRTGIDTYRVLWDHTGSRFFLIERKGERYELTVYDAGGNVLLDHGEGLSRTAADTLCWSRVSDELAFIDARGQLQLLNLEGRQRKISDRALSVGWLPHRRVLVVLEPLRLERVDPVLEGDPPPLVDEGPTLDEETEVETDGETEVEDAETTEDAELGSEEVVEPPLETSSSAETLSETDATDADDVSPPTARPPLEVILAGFTVGDEATLRDPGVKRARFELPAAPPAADEVVRLEADLDDEGRPSLTAAYLYDLADPTEPRRLLGRTDSLPLISPQGRWLLLFEPLGTGQYNLILHPTEEGAEKIFLGRADSPDLPAAWQPEGRGAEGVLSRVILTLLLIVFSLGVLIFLISAYLRHSRRLEKLRSRRELMTDDTML